MNKIGSSVSSTWLNEAQPLIGQNSENSLFDLGDMIANDFCDARTRNALLLEKLSIVKLEPISIPSSVGINGTAPHILNLKQEFTFPVSNFKSQNEAATQTLSLRESRVKTPYPTAATRYDFDLEEPLSRPQSEPAKAVSNHKLYVPRVTADVEPTLPPKYTMCIGDGIENNLKQIKFNAISFEGVGEEEKPVEKTPSKVSMPAFNCKKSFRPQTRLGSQRSHNRVIESSSSSAQSEKKPAVKKQAPKRLAKNSDESDAVVDHSCNYHQKMVTIVDKMQDADWEVNHNALKNFSAIANSIYWESDTSTRYIPVISRKLIDFFRSPRSNLCRTACQTAGDFFLLAKSTKRPEFDEMIDILLCRTADQNRFIQKDANVALDKMASVIPIQHSIRAICSKGPESKNAAVRATAARLLTAICKQSGIESIIGVQANARTRKRVLSNLAKFLVDKNVETRRHSEKLCRMLKRHKFFNDYFFKDIENNMKIPLRRIINIIN